MESDNGDSLARPIVRARLGKSGMGFFRLFARRCDYEIGGRLADIQRSFITLLGRIRKFSQSLAITRRLGEERRAVVREKKLEREEGAACGTGRTRPPVIHLPLSSKTNIFLFYMCYTDGNCNYVGVSFTVFGQVLVSNGTISIA